MGVLVRPIADGDDVSTFDCGHDALNSWIKVYARTNQFRFGTTHVAVEQNTIVGYLAVMSRHVKRERLRGQGPGEWPALLIGRLAVSRSHRGGGVGKALMRRAYEIAIQQHFAGGGCSTVVVDAKLDTEPPAPDYYRKLGFKTFKPDPTDTDTTVERMYLKIENVIKFMEAWAAAQNVSEPEPKK